MSEETRAREVLALTDHTQPDEPHRVIYRGAGLEISTNIPGFKWPTRDEKIDGLLSAGLIDAPEAERLRAKGAIRKPHP